MSQQELRIRVAHQSDVTSCNDGLPHKPTKQQVGKGLPAYWDYRTAKTKPEGSAPSSSKFKLELEREGGRHRVVHVRTPLGHASDRYNHLGFPHACCNRLAARHNECLQSQQEVFKTCCPCRVQACLYLPRIADAARLRNCSSWELAIQAQSASYRAASACGPWRGPENNRHIQLTDT